MLSTPPPVSDRAARTTGWRKVATAIWRGPYDPQIYGDIEIDAEPVQQYIERIRAETSAHVTVTHVVGKAVADALALNPHLNTYLSRGRFVPHDSVDIFFVVAVGDGEDLSGVKVKNADQKSVVEIAEELRGRAARIRTGEDEDFGTSKRVLDATPTPILRFFLRLADRMTGDWKIDLKRFGLPREAFGSAMVTSVAMFGVQRAFGPLSPYFRIPLLALVGEITPQAVVVEGHVIARPILTISATMDHRYVDGSSAARLAKAVRAYLEDPK